MSVYANKDNETIRFKIYESATQTVVDVARNKVFSMDGNIGGIFQFYSIASPKLSESTLINSFNFSGVTVLSTSISSNKTHITLPETTDVIFLTTVFNASINATVYVDDALQILGSNLHDSTNPIAIKCCLKMKSV